jgi:hypothetical protein
MNNLVRKILAKNAKKMRDLPTLPRNFSATAGTRNLKLVLMRNSARGVKKLKFFSWYQYGPLF